MIPPSAPPTPILGLRMRSNRVAPSSSEASASCNVVERVRAMMAMENSPYQCQDYLARRTNEAAAATTADSSIPGNADLDSNQPMVDVDDDVTSSRRDCPPPRVNDEMIDAVCREKMCEWSYRVCDHFHTGREIVAISFSYLDRFVDKCSCDRTAFKLAAMTTLYLATKIFNSKQITIRSLAELSRGEFEMAHISEMEVIILQTLGWRLHPPTPQCFISSLYEHLPVPKGPVSSAIYQRAMFFAELSLYDYTFVTRERSLIAIASIQNAMEGMDESVVTKEQRAGFLQLIKETYQLEYPHDIVENTRNRLWYVYSMSAQYKEDDELSPHTVKQSQPDKRILDSSISQSPVCVRMTGSSQ